MNAHRLLVGLCASALLGLSQTIQINMNTPTPLPPKPETVRNGRQVTVEGAKHFTHDCSVETKRTAIAEPGSAISQLLAVFNLTGGIAALSDEPSPPPPPVPVRAPCTTVSLDTSGVSFLVAANRLKSRIETLERLLTITEGDLKKTRQRFRDGNGKADSNALQNLLAALGKNEPGTEPTHAAALVEVREAARTLRNYEIPDVSELQARFEELQRELGELVEINEADETWLDHAGLRLQCGGDKLEQLAEARTTLLAARKGLDAAYKAADSRLKTNPEGTLELKPDALSYSRALSPDRQARRDGSVTCINAFNPKDKIEVPFVVTYQSPDASLSGGFVASFQEETVFNVEDVRLDGTVTNSTTGIETVNSVKTIVGDREIDFQMIPFSFFNVRYWGKRDVDLRFTVGVGVNTNGPGTAVEYLLSPFTVNIKGANIHWGLHWGRRQELKNGFAVGNQVSGVSSAPVRNPYKPAFGFGLSYDLPLPKAK